MAVLMFHRVLFLASSIALSMRLLEFVVRRAGAKRRNKSQNTLGKPLTVVYENMIVVEAQRRILGRTGTRRRPKSSRQASGAG